MVIPAYNEAQRLPAYLSEVVAYFDGRGEPYEVIVVDDGSADETAARVLEAQAIHQAVTLHRLAENRGKGFAVRAGMRAARGDLRLMTDADGASPIAEVKRLETVIQAGADLAVGSRALPDPSVRREVHIHRKLSGEIFSEDVLVVGEGAMVSAEIDVGVIIVEGNVTGNIRAKRAVELHAPARVKGNIETPSLYIDKGVTFEGFSKMENIGPVATKAILLPRLLCRCAPFRGCSGTGV